LEYKCSASAGASANASGTGRGRGRGRRGRGRGIGSGEDNNEAMYVIEGCCSLLFSLANISVPIYIYLLYVQFYLFTLIIDHILY
jgi:hypothetical protein